jgi:predicted nucleotidyltransferase
LANLSLRDRDAIVSIEGLIFRVFGYTHPPEAFICDLEYAPETLFRSENPKAPRGGNEHKFYKFYEDEAWRFLREKYPQHLIFYKMLQRETVGVALSNIKEVRKPDEKLKALFETKPKDQLVAAAQTILETVTQLSSLKFEDFGVFGSMLHGIHNPRLSDIDLVVYGRRKAAELVETLQELCHNRTSPLRNEFQTDETIRSKRWRFQNLSQQEYLWHQQRKKIYAVYDDEKTGRTIKTEFEPVKSWAEIENKYNPDTKILQKSWIRMSARITEDQDAPFIPSIYTIEPIKIFEGPNEALEAAQIVSYLEEFRMQAKKGETVYVEGNLEQNTSPKNNFFQITLTYCPRYYEQVLKVKN